LPETNQHLRRGLPADAAVDVRFARKILVEMPHVGDGVAEADDVVPAGHRWLEGGVGGAIAGELSEVVAQRSCFGVAPLFERFLSGGSSGLLSGVRGRRLGDGGA